MTDRKSLDYESIRNTPPDILLNLSHAELDRFFAEAQAVMNNAQIIMDWISALRLEKIRRECQSKPAKGDSQ